MRYYFEDQESERGYAKDHFIEEMKERGITEMKVYPAKMIKGEDFAYCTEYSEPVETGAGDCGRFCEFYKPRNGKNGRCRFSSNCYEALEVPITITIK
jgi:hypothetical protein